MTIAPASEAQPPTLWTTVEPAKSVKAGSPRESSSPPSGASSQPPPANRPPHTQLPKMG